MVSISLSSITQVTSRQSFRITIRTKYLPLLFNEPRSLSEYSAGCFVPSTLTDFLVRRFCCAHRWQIERKFAADVAIYDSGRGYNEPVLSKLTLVCINFYMVLRNQWDLKTCGTILMIPVLNSARRYSSYCTLPVVLSPN